MSKLGLLVCVEVYSGSDSLRHAGRRGCEGDAAAAGREMLGRRACWARAEGRRGEMRGEEEERFMFDFIFHRK